MGAEKTDLTRWVEDMGPHLSTNTGTDQRFLENDHGLQGHKGKLPEKCWYWELLLTSVRGHTLIPLTLNCYISPFVDPASSTPSATSDLRNHHRKTSLQQLASTQPQCRGISFSDHILPHFSWVSFCKSGSPDPTVVSNSSPSNPSASGLNWSGSALLRLFPPPLLWRLDSAMDETLVDQWGPDTWGNHHVQTLGVQPGYFHTEFISWARTVHMFQFDLRMIKCATAEIHRNIMKYQKICTMSNFSIDYNSLFRIFDALCACEHPSIHACAWGCRNYCRTPWTKCTCMCPIIDYFIRGSWKL